MGIITGKGAASRAVGAIDGEDDGGRDVTTATAGDRLEK